MDDSIYIVTNRAFRRISAAEGYELRDSLNSKGSRELRLFEATAKGDAPERWRFNLIDDKPDRSSFDGLETAEFLNARASRVRRGSDLVAARMLARLRKTGRNLVLFVHGYNNTAEDAVRRARRISQRYNVEVLVFSWPANGGGDRVVENLHGKASYKSDKSDARASTEALDRVLARMQGLVSEVNAAVINEVVEAVAAEKSDLSGEQHRRRLADRLQQRACPFKVTLLAHSMGNYLYKKMLMSSTERLSSDVVLDNVILKAADANHEKHSEWVERIRTRSRVYVLINTTDAALRLSTLKVGDLQEPRLGNTLAEQDAPGATYLDLSTYVGEAHSYFDRDDLEREDAEALEHFMRKALQGVAAAYGLPYSADTNTYRLGRVAVSR